MSVFLAMALGWKDAAAPSSWFWSPHMRVAVWGCAAVVRAFQRSCRRDTETNLQQCLSPALRMLPPTPPPRS